MAKYDEFKKILFYAKILPVVILSFMLTGCEAILLGSGKSAKIEDTGFFARYDDLKSESDPAFVGLPDLYSIRSGVNWGIYKKVIIPDFTSLATNVRDLSGMQLAEYKTIKKDLPDHLAQAFDGSVFLQCVRTSERIDPKEIEAIKKMPADAILMGNIKEIHSLGKLTVTQVEIKIVDTKNGMEILKAINRSSTDHDKVAMPIVRNLSVLIKKAKSAKVAEPERSQKPDPAIGAVPQPPKTEAEPKLAAAPASQEPSKVTETISTPPATATAKEVQTKVVPPSPAPPEPQAATVVKSEIPYLVATKTANIRSEPNSTSKILGTLKKGDQAKKLDKSGSWFKIKLDSGINGWIFKDLVKETTVVVPTKTISEGPKPFPLTTPAPSFAKSEAGGQTPKVEEALSVKDRPAKEEAPTKSASTEGGAVSSPTAETPPPKDPVKTEAAPASKKDEAALTNEEVVKLCKVGLGDEVVIAKINQTKEVAFKLDPDSLIKLKGEGVSQAVIAAMLKRDKPGPIKSASSKGETDLSQKPFFFKISTKEGDYDLRPINGRLTTGGFIVYIQFMHYPDLKSKVRTTDKRPSFLIKFPAGQGDPRADIYIVKLKQVEKENERELKMGTAHMFKVEIGNPDKEWIVKHEGNEEEGGLWRLKLRSDLSPGEYGLFHKSGSGELGLATKNQLYDFGIDP